MIDLSSLLAHRREGAAGRDLQPRRPSRSSTPRWDQPMVTGEVTAVGRASTCWRRCASGAQGAVLPGLVVGDVRAGPGADAERDDAVLSALALRGGQAVRPLGDGELPRELRPARLVGHPVQPREPAARRRVCHPQGHRRAWRASSSAWPASCGSAISTPSATGAMPRDYVRAMWLMLQQDAPDDYVIATGRTTTRARHVPDRLRLRRPRHGRLREDRPEPLPAGRGRPAAGRSSQGQADARLGAHQDARGHDLEMVDADLARVRMANLRAEV